MNTYTGQDGKVYECGTWEYFGKHYQDYQARITIDAELGISVEIRIDGQVDDYDYHVTFSTVDRNGKTYNFRHISLTSINREFQYVDTITKMHEGMVNKALNYYEIYKI